jgi:hypothetical protein
LHFNISASEIKAERMNITEFIHNPGRYHKGIWIFLAHTPVKAVHGKTNRIESLCVKNPFPLLEKPFMRAFMVAKEDTPFA